MAVGLALLVVPAAFFCLFGVGEVASGDLSGLGHLLQAAPLVLLGLAALRWPTAAGAILLVVGLAIMAAYPAWTGGRFGLGTIAIAEAIFTLPVVSGAMLVLAGRSARGQGVP
jgi:hypothetical protein